jgi:hypothetical protein
MLGLDKDLYSRTTIYIPGLDNIQLPEAAGLI